MIAWRYKGRIVDSVLINKENVVLTMCKGKNVTLNVDLITLRNISYTTEFFTIMYYLSKTDRNITYE